MKFKLSRYFILTSLPVVAIVTAISAYSYIYFMTGVLVEHETKVNQHNTHLLGQILWPRFKPYIIWSKNKDVESLHAAPAVEEIDKIVTDLFYDSDIVKANLYNIDGLIVYSSQHSKIGENESDNPGFVSASNGRVRSNLTWRNEFHAFEKMIMDRDIVSSYVPLYDKNTREIIAVVELYSDVTDLVVSINRARNKIIIGTLACFGLLLGILYVLIMRADRIIKFQNKELINANKEISRLAYLDAVTRLPNRHRFDQELEEHIHHSRRNGEGFSLLYLDLDGFKAINDNYGHAAGDLILAVIAKRILQVLRKADSVYRLGGDEFAMLMPGANTPGAVTKVAEKLLVEIAAPIELGENMHHVSVSIGIACYPRSASNASELIHLADKAMYRAKAKGKNCYEIPQIE